MHLLALFPIFGTMNRSCYACLLLGLSVAAPCPAQRTYVVIDMETRRPLRDVPAYTNTNEQAKTNYQGRFVLIKPFKRLVISHPGYFQLELTAEQAARDTIVLLPKLNKLHEVVVTAKGPRIGPDFKKTAREAAMATPASSGIGFDFFSMFDRSKRHVSKKDRQKMKRILDKY